MLEETEGLVIDPRYNKINEEEMTVADEDSAVEKSKFSRFFFIFFNRFDQSGK